MPGFSLSLFASIAIARSVCSLLHSTMSQPVQKPNGPLQGHSINQKPNGPLQGHSVNQKPNGPLQGHSVNQKPNGPLQGHSVNQKPNGPLQGQSISFDDLQLTIDSGGWKTDLKLCDWIWNSYLCLVETGHNPPDGFGSQEFWTTVDRRYFDDSGDEESMDDTEDLADREFDLAWTEERGKNFKALFFLKMYFCI